MLYIGKFWDRLEISKKIKCLKKDKEILENELLNWDFRDLDKKLYPKNKKHKETISFDFLVKYEIEIVGVSKFIKDYLFLKMTKGE